MVKPVTPANPVKEPKFKDKDKISVNGKPGIVADKVKRKDQPNLIMVLLDGQTPLPEWHNEADIL